MNACTGIKYLRKEKFCDEKRGNQEEGGNQGKMLGFENFP